MLSNILSLLIFIPIIAALAALFIHSSNTRFFKIYNLVVCGLQLILLVFVFSQVHLLEAQQFILVEKANWFSISLGSFGILRAEYFIGIDGLSFSMILLTIIVMIIAGISSWTIKTNQKGYYVLLLILNGSIIGTFSALDFLLFYLFFEFMLLPMYFLIGIWGGARREYASIKFLLYTLLGSILILIVLIALYISVKSPESQHQIIHSFNILDMSDSNNFIDGSVLSLNGWSIGAHSARYWAFLLLFIGFAIKLPAVPLHTWLPDAHVEAPTPISVILAALLLKIGAYGILRIAYPIFPEIASQLSWFVALVGVISIIYGGLNALASKDLKRLIAYSSVSHMGFVLLGVASVTHEGISGAIYQMFSHGILSALLFLIAGVLYDRTHDRSIQNYSGLGSKMPQYFTLVLIAFFASLGLPGFSGFIGEIMILLGAFQSNTTNGLLHESYAIIATSGLLIGAGYFLWTIQRMFFGPFNTLNKKSEDQLTDLDRRELSMMVPLALLALIFGIFPQILLDAINPFATRFVESVFSFLSTP